MKTTLDLDDELLVRAKALAAREGRSLTGLIEDGLRLRLRVRRQGTGKVAEPEIAVYAGRGGLVRGVDPLSNRSLEDAADDDA
jgi:plasmid stability protein